MPSAYNGTTKKPRSQLNTDLPKLLSHQEINVSLPTATTQYRTRKHITNPINNIGIYFDVESVEEEIEHVLKYKGGQDLLNVFGIFVITTL